MSQSEDDIHEEKEFRSMNVGQMLNFLGIRGRAREHFNNLGWLDKNMREIHGKWYDPTVYSDIKKVYRSKILKNHPDKGAGACRNTFEKVFWMWNSFFEAKFASREQVVDLTNGSSSEGESMAGDGVDSDVENEESTKRASSPNENSTSAKKLCLPQNHSSSETTNTSLVIKPSSPPSPSSKIKHLMGKEVCTAFWFQGIVKYIWQNENENGVNEYLHHVVYEDGDKEDLTFEELRRLDRVRSVKGRKKKSSYDKLGNKDYQFWKIFTVQGKVTGSFEGADGREKIFFYFTYCYYYFSSIVFSSFLFWQP